MKSLLFVLFFVVSLSFMYATVWHVNNAEGVLKDFNQPQEANDSPSVLPGDTLYIYSGTYNAVTLNKRLVMIGTGYFLNENSDLQANQSPSILQSGWEGLPSITFSTGSEGSTVTGLSIYYNMSVNVDNVTIKRNYFFANVGYTYLHSLTISSARNILILQNYLIGGYRNTGSIYNYNPINIEGNYGTSPTGIQIIGNIVLGNTYYYPYYPKLAISSSAACLIENNTITGNIDVVNANVKNNILLEGTYNGHDTSFIQNNLSDGEQFAPNGQNGNLCNVSMNSVFQNTGSTDGLWQLAPGSPAIGAGLGGVDCGAFGGAHPYVLSGMPSEIPTIYFFSSTSAGYTYPIHIKAKTH